MKIDKTEVKYNVYSYEYDTDKYIEYDGSTNSYNLVHIDLDEDGYVEEYRYSADEGDYWNDVEFVNMITEFKSEVSKTKEGA